MDLNPLFEFVQVAMGNRSSLPAYMDGADWQSLFDGCQRQAIAGIGFAALERLRGLGMECPEPLRMQWWSVACQLKEQNRELNRQCAELSRQYGHDGLSVCMLSGQGNLLNYPEKLQMRRVPEGMEVWCVPSYGGMDIAVQTGKEGVGTPVMSPSEVMAVLRSFGLARFVAAVMYALLAAFAMPASYVLCEPNEVDGRRWLSSLSTSSDSVWPLRGGWLRR